MVSIGLPVYNGENYLRQALESITSQTWGGGFFADLEIVISDNCSTDGTEAICREYAAADERIHYHRQSENIGAGPNYNYVFHHSRGRYFKWSAHDDYMDSSAMEVCALALEADPKTVLCHPRLVDVDSGGEVIGEFDRGDAGLQEAAARFFQVIQIDHNCAEVFGLTRRSILLKTGLIRDYTDSDRTLLGELALRGRLRQETGARFFRRIHEEKSDRVYSSYNERAEWFNPRNKEKIVLSACSQLRDLSWSVLRCGLPWSQKMRCGWLLAKVAKWNAPLFRKEFAWAWRRGFGRV